MDAGLESLVLQKEEVQDAKWVTAEELKEMIEKHQFHNYGKEYFEHIFSL